MLAMQHNFLPPGNKLPTSYEAALRSIEPYLVQPITYDVCKNDCIVYRKEYADVSVCPTCASGRYIAENSSTPV